MAGGGGSISKLVSTKTPVFIFHGADDRVVGPSSDRALAKQLLENVDSTRHAVPRHGVQYGAREVRIRSLSHDPLVACKGSLGLLAHECSPGCLANARVLMGL